MSTRGLSEASLARATCQELSRLLPPLWDARVDDSNSPGTLVVAAPSGRQQTFRLDMWKNPTPAELATAYRTIPTEPVIAAAPYLSPRSREVLEAANVPYLDLTGNARLSIDEPGLALRTDGAQRDPNPRSRPERGISGKAAGRVIRALADYRPPYSVTDLAALADVSPGYCSRTLQALEREALVQRARGGTILSANWQATLRRRGQIVRLFDPRRSTGWIARGGIDQVMDALLKVDSTSYAVTGSFAASRIRAIVAPAGLAIYANDPEQLADDLDLLRAESGSDVRLILPTQSGEMARAQIEKGITWVGLSQLVIDCFGGPGRMPQEGDAVLEWMTENEDAWRRLPEVARP